MRTLMWFTLGFSAACAAGIYLELGGLLLILCGVLLVICAGLWLYKANWSRCTAVFLLGCVVGGIWLTGFDRLYLEDARQLDNQELTTSIRISDYSVPTERGVCADGRICVDGREYRVRVYLDKEVSLEPADVLEGTYTMRFTGFGGPRAATAHQGEGIFLLAYAKEYTLAGKSDMRITDLPAKLRREIGQQIEGLFEQDTAPFAKALLLGDTDQLDYDTRTDFSVSGIRHVVAVSGLHVSILFGAVCLFSGRRKTLMALIGIPLLLLFAAVAGFTPSVVRASLMQILLLLALLINREYDPPTALSASVLVMLLVDPVTVTAVSFQLSAGCLVGIFLFSRRINGYLLDTRRLGRWHSKSVPGRLSRWFSGSVSVSISATVVTAPLCGNYFGSVSILGIVTNLLTLWMITFIFCGILLACILGAFWQGLGSCVAWVIGWLIRAVRWISGLIAAVPMAAVYTCSIYIVLWLAFCYVLLAAFFLFKRKRPALLVGCAVIGLVISLAASWIEPRLDKFRLQMLDVGQGQAILLQYEDRHYLVDCGGDSAIHTADLVAGQLLSQGVSSLDGVILTHYDTDHAAGLPLLLSRIPADRLYLPGTDRKEPLALALESGYAQSIRWIEPDSCTSLPDAPITLLTTGVGEAGNESSMCVLFQPENCDILITGDRGMAGERALADSYALPEFEVLVVGHHGSKDSTSFELLDETRPKLALISVGDNAYGHPAEDVLDRLRMYGCRILRTDLDGTILLRG